MRRLVFAVALLAAGPAYAADFHLTLSPEDVQYLGVVLGKEPFKDVAPLLTKLQKQINEQNAANAAAPQKDKTDGKGK